MNYSPTQLHPSYTPPFSLTSTALASHSLPLRQIMSVFALISTLPAVLCETPKFSLQFFCHISAHLPYLLRLTFFSCILTVPGYSFWHSTVPSCVFWSGLSDSWKVSSIIVMETSVVLILVRYSWVWFTQNVPKLLPL